MPDEPVIIDEVADVDPSKLWPAIERLASHKIVCIQTDRSEDSPISRLLQRAVQAAARQGSQNGHQHAP